MHSVWRMATRQLALLALFNNVDGSENTAVGKATGRNVITGFNNTYIGNFVGTLAADESNTIRIGDLLERERGRSLECYIGGIFNNFQPVGGTVVHSYFGPCDRPPWLGFWPEPAW